LKVLANLKNLWRTPNGCIYMYVPVQELFLKSWRTLFGSPAYAITWRPSSSSVSTARFVTAGPTHPKLCTYVPLGKSNSQSSLILGLATRGPKPKTQKVL
jgi:hypothetical protein